MIIKNIKIILLNKIIQNGWIEINKEKIISVNEGATNKKGIDGKGNYLFPGFIDCHVHGGYGVDFEDATIDAFNLLAKKIASEGVTSYCQATVTQPDEITSKSLKVYSKWMKEENNKFLKQAKQIGCHIEGPFISLEKKGAHKAELIKKCDVKLMKKWISDSGNNIKIVTYAPESDANSKFVKFLVKNKIIASAGHSNCKSNIFEKKAFNYQCNHITHLFNAMSGVNQHHPGLATAGLINNQVLCELISDGIHVKPDVIKLIYELKKDDGICLITDATKPKGLADGNYNLGPLETVKKGMKVIIKNTNNLAGSVATYDHCVRFFKKTTKINDIGLAKITSYNIAKQLKIDHLTGQIKPNLYADLVLLDKKYQVLKTIVHGQIVYQK